ncbi:MAG: cobalamin-dependent protein, partial [Vulcanimicrobiaceae bacterium]
MPSIQLGTLEAVLRRDDLPVRSMSLFLHFVEFLRYKSSLPEANFNFGIDDYYLIAEGSFLSGMGDWVFAGEPYMGVAADPEAYFQSLSVFTEPRAVEACRFARAQVAEFVEIAARTILKDSPKIVGFTTTFAQSIPSLSLARALKEADPSVVIVFGGANCEASMGETLIESFPWVDYVVRGEGEYAFPQLVRAICGEGSLRDIAGLCFRADGAPVILPFGDVVTVKPDDIPEPIFDEYFNFIRTSALGRDIRHMLQLPVESARGCWWGEKHHCTFCGLNGLTMAFRSKSPDKFVS